MSATDILTAVLAVVTAWMAWETRCMAGTSLSAFELETEPHLAIKDVRYQWEQCSDTAFNLHLFLVVSNPGKVVVSYEVAARVLTIAGRTPAMPSLNEGGLVHPGIDHRFSYPVVEKIPGQEFPVIGNAEIALVFDVARSKKSARRTISAKLFFSIAAPPASHIDWRYVGLPTYS